LPLLKKEQTLSIEILVMFRKILIYLLLAVVLLFTGYMLFLYHADYSNGFRAGYVSKLSRKGVVFKTWEGQLITGAILKQGSDLNNTWDFSILDKNADLLPKIEEAIAHNKMVKLFYSEKYKVLRWRGDTPYFVEKVEVIE
jgi:hypothetical protein